MASAKIIVENTRYTAEIGSDGRVIVNGREVGWVLEETEGELTVIRDGGKRFFIYCRRVDPTTAEIWIKHFVYRVTLEDRRSALMNRFQSARASTRSQIEIKAPMPGLITRISVAEGESIEKDSKLITLEAMKMENEIRSPIVGKISAIKVARNDRVEKGQALIFVEAR
jgi:biotin carboxyl carrier protein